MGIYEELEWRGLIKDVSSPELKEKLNKGERYAISRRKARQVRNSR